MSTSVSASSDRTAHSRLAFHQTNATNGEPRFELQALLPDGGSVLQSSFTSASFFGAASSSQALNPVDRLFREIAAQFDKSSDGFATNIRSLSLDTKSSPQANFFRVKGKVGISSGDKVREVTVYGHGESLELAVGRAALVAFNASHFPSGGSGAVRNNTKRNPGSSYSSAARSLGLSRDGALQLEDGDVLLSSKY